MKTIKKIFYTAIGLGLLVPGLVYGTTTVPWQSTNNLSIGPNPSTLGLNPFLAIPSLSTSTFAGPIWVNTITGSTSALTITTSNANQAAPIIISPGAGVGLGSNGGGLFLVGSKASGTLSNAGQTGIISPDGNSPADIVISAGTSTGTNGNIQFGTNGSYLYNGTLTQITTPQMTVAGNGKIGINNTTPSAMLQIYNSNSSSSDFLVNDVHYPDGLIKADSVGQLYLGDCSGDVNDTCITISDFAHFTQLLARDGFDFVSDATTTFAAFSTTGKGIDLSGGCYAINGTCIGGSSGSGTVTSVAASGGTTGLTFSGSPITTSGTLTLGGTLAVANGGTGQTAFGQGWLGVNNSGAIISSTSPTVNYITATSSTATSTFSGGISGANNFTVQSSSGRVGVNTATPQTTFDVNGLISGGTFASTNRNTLDMSGSVSAGEIDFNVKNGAIFAAIGANVVGTGDLYFQMKPLSTGWSVLNGFLGQGLIVSTAGANPIRLQTNGVDRIYLSGTGKNVGFSTMSPGSVIDAIGDSNYGILSRNTDGGTFLNMAVNSSNVGFIGTSQAASSNLGLYVTTAGSLGVSSSSPYATLSVKGIGTTNPFAVGSSTNRLDFSIDDREHVVVGGNGFTVSSCGSASNSGNDNVGTVIPSGVVTSCTIAFGTPFKKTPVVVLTAESSLAVWATSISPTGFTITSGGSLGGVTIQFIVEQPY